jgi:hypothetical protein
MEDNLSTSNVLQKGPSRRDIIWLLSQLTYHLIRIALRHQVLVPEMESLLRWQAAVIAMEHEEFAMANERRNKASASHAAVVTGLGRREIAELTTHDGPPIDNDGGKLHRIIQILTAWTTEDAYKDEDGKPIDLPVTGKAPSLHALNLRFGRSVTDRSLADWLVDNGNAEWLTDPSTQHRGKLLRWKDPVVRSAMFSPGDLRILGQIGSDFLHSLQASLNPKVSDQPRLRQLYFLDIDQEKMTEAHQALKEAMREALDHFNEVLSPFRTQDHESTGRLGIGLYTFKDVNLLESD